MTKCPWIHWFSAVAAWEGIFDRLFGNRYIEAYLGSRYREPYGHDQKHKRELLEELFQVATCSDVPESSSWIERSQSGREIHLNSAVDTVVEIKARPQCGED